MEDLRCDIDKEISKLNQTVNEKITPQLSEINLMIENRNEDINACILKEIDKLIAEISKRNPIPLIK